MQPKGPNRITKIGYGDKSLKGGEL